MMRFEAVPTYSFQTCFLFFNLENPDDRKEDWAYESWTSGMQTLIPSQHLVIMINLILKQ